MLKVLIVLALLFSSAPAFAIDEECVNPEILNVWPCYDGTCRFCTPLTLTDDPEGTLGQPGIATSVTCEGLAEGIQFGLAANLEPGVVVVMQHNLEGDMNAGVRCDDGLNISETIRLTRFSSSPKPLPTTLGGAVVLP